MMKIKKLSLVIMAKFLIVGLSKSNQASSKIDWRLRYIKGAPTSEYKWCDDVWAKARGKECYMTVDSINGGAIIRLKLDYGASPEGEVFSKKGQTIHSKYLAG